MAKILKCEKCNTYTLEDTCKCGGNAISPLPPKLKDNDRWSKYRREYKRNNS